MAKASKQAAAEVVETQQVATQVKWEGYPSRDTKTPIPGYNVTTGQYETTEQPNEEVSAAILDGE
jgi:hypothetical protein